MVSPAASKNDLRVSKPARSRGPSPAKTARTREAIIAAALDLFLEGGFAATRMADVAARAGIAKGTLYLHFADKAALFEGVLQQVIAEPLSGLVGAVIGPEERVRDFLWRMAGPVLRDMETSRRGPVLRLILAEGGRFPVLAETYRRLVIDPGMAAFRHLARRALERGEIQSDALARFPQLMAGPAVLAVLWNGLFAGEDPIEPEAMFLAWLDLVFGPPLPSEGGTG
ncbi:TetR/AcrR family transcriptional regulator [Belnapia sp. T6]|uniref:TetR/AcrR family transcriptional regulator n=1 Tax=Belnapia mucosa TaxID=2804532 RepID=A0ABS1V0Y4_9PROT|nr:TetR/AcrR family transcriptional regulator [Belnapia mucosa]MBL6454912.1 TetR/AcrR family transcriptional regulator [Belnapia mucosa]